MFDEKDKKVWQRISAPDTLEERIKEKLLGTPRSNNRKKLQAFTLLAASFAVVLVSLFLLRAPDSPKLYLADGTPVTDIPVRTQLPAQPAQAMVRSVVTDSVELVLDLEEQTEITAENGNFNVKSEDGTLIFSGISFRIAGKIILEWTYPVTDVENSVKIILKGEKTEHEILLESNTNTATRTLSCVRK